jgi:hypothetical protein
VELVGESRRFGRRGIPRGRLARRIVVEVVARRTGGDWGLDEVVVVRSLVVIVELVSRVEQQRCPDSHHTNVHWDLAGMEHIQVAR